MGIEFEDRKAAPGDMEPGGRLYRVRVLVPMQERHWDLEKTFCDLGVFIMLPIAIFISGVAKEGAIVHAYIVMGLLAGVIGFRAWVWWLDRKRERLGEEHERLVRQFGTREVPWRP